MSVLGSFRSPRIATVAVGASFETGPSVRLSGVRDELLEHVGQSLQDIFLTQANLNSHLLSSVGLVQGLKCFRLDEPRKNLLILGNSCGVLAAHELDGLEQNGSFGVAKRRFWGFALRFLML